MRQPRLVEVEEAYFDLQTGGAEPGQFSQNIVIRLKSWPSGLRWDSLTIAGQHYPVDTNPALYTLHCYRMIAREKAQIPVANATLWGRYQNDVLQLPLDTLALRHWIDMPVSPPPGD
jgi:hypothetical protein